jgi:hypothetical protein
MDDTSKSGNNRERIQRARIGFFVIISNHFVFLVYGLSLFSRVRIFESTLLIKITWERHMQLNSIFINKKGIKQYQ